jgi:hypothetical protein
MVPQTPHHTSPKQPVISLFNATEMPELAGKKSFSSSYISYDYITTFSKNRPQRHQEYHAGM